MAATQEIQNKVAGIVRRLLEEQFNGRMVFDPILVQPEIDHDEEEYLHIYVVYDGKWEDWNEADRLWNAGLQHLVLQEMPVEELPVVPTLSICEKSEWYEEIPEDELY